MNVNTTQSLGMTEDERIDAITAKSAEKLKKEPRVKVRIPKLPGDDQVVECCLNGYNFIIRRGETVELPEPVVLLLENAGIV